MLAGGGMRTGQAIGTTNRLGEHASDSAGDVQRNRCDDLPQYRPGPDDAHGSRPERPTATLGGTIADAGIGVIPFSGNPKMQTSRPFAIVADGRDVCVLDMMVGKEERHVRDSHNDDGAGRLV